MTTSYVTSYVSSERRRLYASVFIMRATLGSLSGTMLCKFPQPASVAGIQAAYVPMWRCLTLMVSLLSASFLCTAGRIDKGQVAAIFTEVVDRTASTDNTFMI